MTPLSLDLANQEVDVDPDQTLEEMAEILRAGGINVTAQQIAAEIDFRTNEKLRRDMDIQLAAAKAHGTRRILRDDRGSSFGEVPMQMVQSHYMQFEKLYGKGFMRDDGSVRDVLKHHPEYRVKTVNDRLTIVKPEFGAKSAPARGRVRGKRGRWAI